MFDNAWSDIPDARVEPATAEGQFLVTAPKFGGGSGFHRVVNSVALPGDPIMDTLSENDPEEIILFWNQPNGKPTNNTVSGKLYYQVIATPGGSISNNTLKSYPDTNSPAFILPWRLDPEKGDSLTDPSLRQLTHEIMTLPTEPRPGEEVRLMARVSNSSLLGTPTTCKVRFYLGDPAANGTLITATFGRTEVLTPGGIPAHGKNIVELPWRIPGDTTDISIKIYAVIDAENQIDEIHEDNNVGWNEIFLRQTP